MTLRIEDWGFAADGDGALVIGGVRADHLAAEFGTPLHVVDERGLRERARRLRAAFGQAWPGDVTVYFAMKSNNVPGVARMVLGEGLSLEVATPYEWCLARRLGAPPCDIMLNGPNKGALLGTAVQEGAGLIVVDGPHELATLDALCTRLGCHARVLLRLNPNVVPRGMNRASATGSRTHSVFGFDVVSGEVERALHDLTGSRGLELAGLHCHVGTGIRRPADYRRPLEILARAAARARDLGHRVDVLNVGGGFGVPTSRELDTLEFLLYQAVGRLPKAPDPARFPTIECFAQTVAETLAKALRRHGFDRLPRLVTEPGRAIVSRAGVLLVGVGSVKQRDGVGTWVVTDGGAGTVAFPLFYEYHEIFVCRAPRAPRTERYSLVGPVCFSADWLYRNKRMPAITPGDVLAICDAGAYFTVQESNFGFPHPAIVAVRDGAARLLRRRETFDDMVSRDVAWSGESGDPRA
jgi:diaminopimelate decarboxylase